MPLDLPFSLERDCKFRLSAVRERSGAALESLRDFFPPLQVMFRKIFLPAPREVFRDFFPPLQILFRNFFLPATTAGALRVNPATKVGFAVCSSPPPVWVSQSVHARHQSGLR